MNKVEQGKMALKLYKNFTSPIAVLRNSLVALGILILVIYLIVDYNNVSQDYTDLQRINIQSTPRSKEDFYVDWVDTTYESDNKDEEVTSSALDSLTQNGGQSALSGTSITFSGDAVKVQQLLEASGKYQGKASAFALVYDVITPIWGVNAAVGLMANVAQEGSERLVEYAFSTNHAWGFTMPDAGSSAHITTLRDLQYYIDWDSTTQDKGSYNYKKGSCGVGSVQWSFGRRVAVASLAKSYMSSDADVTDLNWQKAERDMFANELEVGSSYYTAINSHISSDSVEDWAEVFCDYYIVPYKCCGSKSKMTAAGETCRSRRAIAADIAGILKSGGM